MFNSGGSNNNLFTRQNTMQGGGGGGGSNNLFSSGGGSGGGNNNLFNRGGSGGGSNNFMSQGNNSYGNGNNSTNGNWNMFRRNENNGGNSGYNNSGGGNNNLFGGGGNNGRSNNFLTGSGGGGGGNNSNNLFGGGHGYNTRNNSGGGSGYDNYGDIGSVNCRIMFPMGKDNFEVQCITAMSRFKKKSLNEIRLEDYALMKQGKIPDELRRKIESNMSGGGNRGNNMFQSSGSNFGLRGGSGNSSLSLQRGQTVAPGGGGNNMFGNSGGGNSGGGNNLFGNSGGGGGSSGGGNNLFGGGGNSGGGNSSNNLFQTQRSGSNNLFGGGGSSGGGGGGGSSGNNNLFGNRGGSSSGGGGGSGSNLFSNSGGQNRQGYNQGGGNSGGNNLFANRGGGGASVGGGNNSLFPNQQNQGGQQNQQLFPNQGYNNQQQQFYPNQGGQPYQQPPYYPNAPYGYPPNYPPYPYHQPPYQYPGGYYQQQYPPELANHPGMQPYPQQQGEFTYSTFNKDVRPRNDINSNYGAYSIFNKGPEFNFDKYQNNLNASFGPDGRDPKQTYQPRKSLDELARNLDNATSLSSRENQPNSLLTFNPFEKSDKPIDRASDDQLGSIRPYTAISLIRKNDDPVYDQRYRDLDDFNEFSLRPKSNEALYINNTRNRSSSPITRGGSASFLDQRSSNGGAFNKKNIYDNTVIVHAVVGISGKESKEKVSVKLHRGCQVIDLKRKIVQALTTTHKISADSEAELEISNNADLFFESVLRSNNKETLESIGISSDGQVFMQISLPNESNSYANEKASSNEYENQGAVATKGQHFIPKLTRSEYSTIPSIQVLQHMSEEELREVEGFTISNKHGKIEFAGKTDVTYLDLDDLVYIQRGSAEVYPESKYTSEDMKDPQGKKLNKEAVITLTDCFFQGGDLSKLKKKLAKKAKENGYDFLDYDENRGIYKVRVYHFTKYGFEDSDEDDEQDQDSEDQQIQKDFNMPNMMQQDSNTYQQGGDFYSNGGNFDQDHQIITPDMTSSIKVTRDMLDSQHQADRIMPREGAFSKPDRTDLRQSNGAPTFSQNTPQYIEEPKQGMNGGFKPFGRQQQMQNGQQLGIIGEKSEELSEEADQFMLQQDDEMGQNSESPSTKFRKRHQITGSGRKAIRIDDENNRFVMNEDGDGEDVDELINEMDGKRLDDYSELGPSNEILRRMEIADQFQMPTREKLPASDLATMDQQLNNRYLASLNNIIQINETLKGTNNQSSLNKDKPFYMNRSFRVGWTRNGFAMPTTLNNIGIHKAILHRDLTTANHNIPQDDSLEKKQQQFDYDSYKQNIKILSKDMYTPLMESLINTSTRQNVPTDQMEQLNIQPQSLDIEPSQSHNEPISFPGVDEFVLSIADYISAYLENEDERAKKFISLFNKDMEVISLLNTLFGNYEVDLWHFSMQTEKESEVPMDEKEIEERLKIFKKSAEIKRKHALSRWLEKKAAIIVERELEMVEEAYENKVKQNDDDDEKKLCERLLLLLTSRQIKRASNEAKKYDLNRLSVLISEFSTNTFVQKSIHQQVNQWKKSGDLDMISFHKLYQFMTGERERDQMTDWSKLLGVDLWYRQSPNKQLSEVFLDVYESIVEGRYPMKLTTFLGNETHYELGFSLMLIFSQVQDCQPCNIFNTQCYTGEDNKFDVKYLWLIDQYLTKIQQHFPLSEEMREYSQSCTINNNEYRYRILRSFCYQLELLGLWQYAIYALKIAPNDVISEGGKEKYIRTLVDLHYKENEIFYPKEGIQKNKTKKSLLINKLGVNRLYLNEAKAYKYQYKFSFERGIKNLLKSNQWNLAHQAIFNNYAPIIFCNSLSQMESDSLFMNLEKLDSFLENIQTSGYQVDDWNQKGSILLRFIDILRLKNSGSVSLDTSRQEDMGNTVAGILELCNHIQYLKLRTTTDAQIIMTENMMKQILEYLMQSIDTELLSKLKDKIVSCLNSIEGRGRDDFFNISLDFMHKVLV